MNSLCQNWELYSFAPKYLSTTSEIYDVALHLLLNIEALREVMLTLRHSKQH